jgi:hypothetical protein
MTFFLEVFGYVLLYLLTISTLHFGYEYIKTNYTTPVKINNTVNHAKYDELIKEIRETKQNDYESMNDDLSKMIDEELVTEIP